MDQDSLAQTQQIVNAAIQTLRIEIVDAKRHASVLTEGLQMHLDRSHTDDRACLDEEFRETRALIERLSSI